MFPLIVAEKFKHIQFKIFFTKHYFDFELILCTKLKNFRKQSRITYHIVHRKALLTKLLEQWLLN